MIHMMKENPKFLRLPADRRVTMRAKLMMYLLGLILAALGMLLLLFTVIGGYLPAESQIAQMMKAEINPVADHVSDELEAYTGYGLQLAGKLQQEIGRFLDENGTVVSDLNDDPQRLMDVQNIMYSELDTTIRAGRSSGVFALVNATVNTEIPGADQSRCGVYLRLINVSSDVILSPETTLFRGNREIAEKNGLELHSRWNMELDAGGIPGFQELMDNAGQTEGSCYWISRMNLKNTWEDVILLVIPMTSDAGEFLGVCGIELNAMHFRLKYPAAESPCGPVITVIAPVENGCLRTDQGMFGNTEGTWLENGESLQITDENPFYSTYHSSRGDYYGIQKPLEIPGTAGRQWAAAVLIPQESCDRYILRNNACIIGVILGFILIMGTIAWWISKKFVRPILQSFRDIREGQQASAGGYRCKELEELCACLAEKTRTSGAGELPRDMGELLEQYAENDRTLTRAEYNTFRFYMKGYRVSQIPEAACISMSTVKKHNGNIYRKLGISSYEELMMYLDLFRRCGFIGKLQRDEDTGDSGNTENTGDPGNTGNIGNPGITEDTRADRTE